MGKHIIGTEINGTETEAENNQRCSFSTEDSAPCSDVKKIEKISARKDSF